jgi:hypothetical protein
MDDHYGFFQPFIYKLYLLYKDFLGNFSGFISSFDYQS